MTTTHPGHLGHPIRPARTARAARAVLPLAAALAAVGVSSRLPLLGPLLVALVIGALVANSRLASHRLLDGHAALTRLLLRLGVVVLGLRLPLADIASIGVSGVVVVVVTVGATFSSTRWAGRRMGLDAGFVTLLAAGFSICGAAAIAAVDDAVRAREKDVAHAVALVTVFGTAMIVLVPWGGARLGLTTEQAAVWAGASIHEVAQVVAAASVVGSGAVAVAMTVKLGRVALLAPTYLVAARGSTAGGGVGVALVPWFLVGFVAMVALRSTGLLPAPALAGAEHVTTLLLAAGMFGLGLGMRLRELWPIPRRRLLLATLSTTVAAGTSLALVVALP
ncbi:MAG: putative sulfate exporter family transporter [Nocardioides marinisabuli]|uniref:YeiH family protein n=1 Tax=Nocardioides marinisabuli TaxID=419476 RepID=UPI0032196AC7